MSLKKLKEFVKSHPWALATLTALLGSLAVKYPEVVGVINIILSN